MGLERVLKTVSFMVLAGVVLAISLFIGLMIATAGGAAYPPLIKVAAPFVCAGEFRIESRRYSRGPGHSGTQRLFYCVDDATGAEEEITMYAVFIAFLLYSGIIFVTALAVLAPLTFIIFRSSKKTAARITASLSNTHPPRAWPASGPYTAPRQARVTPARIIFNGREYASADEMPAEARAAYEQAMGVFTDADRNGIPDIFEDAGRNTARSAEQAASGSADPAERLRKLKELFDSGLITEQEYETKRAEILSQM